MLACHRLGRTDDALRAYRQARTLLRDELGVEPAAELRELHARILADDPLLRFSRRRPAVPADTTATDTTATDTTATSPDEVVRLPLRRIPLVGRAEELSRLTELLATRALTTIVGTAGCGKTRLAVEAARAAAGTFPDGVCFVALSSAVDDAGVLDAVTSAVGVPTPTAGSPEEVLRAFTRKRHMLLVLDNCEHVLDAAADLVQGLMTEDSELVVLATSREPLDLDGEAVQLLQPLALPAPDAPDLAASPAMELFLQRLPTRSAGDLTADEMAAAARIAIGVDGVPPALELAAARAYTLAEIADQVTADPSTLSRIGRSSAGRHHTVREAIHGSYRLLPADEARLHRRLSAVPGPFTQDLAKAVLGARPRTTSSTS